MSPKSGRENRKQRIINNNYGGWENSSQEFIRLASILFEHSADYARKYDSNCSIYTLAGIPMLFSALRCLLIELNSDILSLKKNLSREELAESPNDIHLIIKRYKLPQTLKINLNLLSEVRHEIIHPSHKPTDTKHNTPSYLVPLREEGLFQSRGGEDSDYMWISQLQSHKLFKWAFEQIASTVDLLLDQHDISDDTANDISKSYAGFRNVAL